MTNTLSSALVVMIVGMLTVFSILTIIILCGNLLIRLVNFGVKPQTTESKESQVSIPAAHQVVISTVVHEVTDGKATDIKIEKI